MYSVVKLAPTVTMIVKMKTGLAIKASPSSSRSPLRSKSIPRRIAINPVNASQVRQANQFISTAMRLLTAMAKRLCRSLPSDLGMTREKKTVWNWMLIRRSFTTRSTSSSLNLSVQVTTNPLLSLPSLRGMELVGVVLESSVRNLAKCVMLIILAQASTHTKTTLFKWSRSLRTWIIQRANMVETEIRLTLRTYQGKSQPSHQAKASRKSKTCIWRESSTSVG